jgi:general secretion pathway protein B
MSSILDALERASQERSLLEQGLPPEKDFNASPGLRWWLWLLFVLGIGAVGGGVFWIDMNQSLAKNVREMKKVASIELRVETQKKEKPPIQQADLTAQLIDRAIPSERSLLAEAKTSHQQYERPKPTAARTTEITQQKASVQDMIPLASKVESLPKPRSEVATTKPSVPQDGEVSEIPPLRSDPQNLSQPAQQPEMGLDEDIPLVWELPHNLREDLRQLKMSIHVYHQDPRRRFVLINRHRYVEGEVLKGSYYRLQRIDREGVVIDYGEGRVRLRKENY